ncbi:MAG: ABC transporter ATP-binding protein [Mailhella sp.]
MTNDLRLRELRYSVKDGNGMRVVLNIPKLDLPGGSRTAIYGPSGSGKTSFLNILCGLILPDRRKGSELSWGENRIDRMGERQRDAWRGAHVGLLFQDFQLFSHLSALENVLLPATFRFFALPDELKFRAGDLLRRLGIRQHAMAGVLSRGEQQRVALARAVLFRPLVLLADEPTASLDVSNAQLVMNELIDLAESEGTTLLVVTHERLLCQRMDFMFKLDRGSLTYAEGKELKDRDFLMDGSIQRTVYENVSSEKNA